MSKKRVIYLAVMIAAIGALCFDKVVLRSVQTEENQSGSLAETTRPPTVLQNAVQNQPDPVGRPADRVVIGPNSPIVKRWQTVEGDTGARLDRDVFQRPASKPPQADLGTDGTLKLANEPIPFKVAGVMVQGSHSYALIDGEVYRPGDRIGRWRLAEVRTASIVMEFMEIKREIAIDSVPIDAVHR